MHLNSHPTPQGNLEKKGSVQERYGRSTLPARGATRLSSLVSRTWSGLVPWQRCVWSDLSETKTKKHVSIHPLRFHFQPGGQAIALLFSLSAANASFPLQCPSLRAGSKQRRGPFRLCPISPDELAVTYRQPQQSMYTTLLHTPAVYSG
jgi:hypothetical protein